MGNMSYCKFENTLPDLRECYDSMDESDLSESEARARLKIIKLCQRIVEDFGVEVVTP